MAILSISENEMLQLRDWANQGMIAEAWDFLGSKGDAYAFLAGAIVSEDTAAMHSIALMFNEMVRSQWENTAGAGVWGGEVFLDVGKRHLENYLKLLGDIPVIGGYQLPDTIDIETSYKEALGHFGLPPIAAIDSLFSVLDLAAGNGNDSLPNDFSWAQVMNIANILMGGPAWEADRIQFNSEVFKNDVDPVTAVVTLGRVIANTFEGDGASVLGMIPFLAPAYWSIKLVDAVLDFTMMDFARRHAAQVIFKRLDETLSTEDIDSLLESAGNDDRVVAGNLIDSLSNILGIALPSSNSSPS